MKGSRQPGSGLYARSVRAWFDLTNDDERRVLLIVLTVLLFGLIMRANHLRRTAGIAQLPVTVEESETVEDHSWE